MEVQAGGPYDEVAVAMISELEKLLRESDTRRIKIAESHQMMNPTYRVRSGVWSTQESGLEEAELAAPLNVLANDRKREWGELVSGDRRDLFPQAVESLENGRVGSVVRIGWEELSRLLLKKPSDERFVGGYDGDSVLCKAFEVVMTLDAKMQQGVREGALDVLEHGKLLGVAKFLDEGVERGGFFYV